MSDMNGLDWKKSSRSMSNGACVEVVHLDTSQSAELQVRH